MAGSLKFAEVLHEAKEQQITGSVLGSQVGVGVIRCPCLFQIVSKQVLFLLFGLVFQLPFIAAVVATVNLPLLTKAGKEIEDQLKSPESSAEH